jgi:hypothetical protein
MTMNTNDHISDAKRANGPFDVNRKIPLEAVAAEQLQEVMRQLRAMEPVFDAEVASQGQLRIAYDASRIGLRDIEMLLDKSGIARSGGLWSKLKLAWYRFLDENAKANAGSGGGACCNRPPPVPHGRDTGKARPHE